MLLVARLMIREILLVARLDAHLSSIPILRTAQTTEGGAWRTVKYISLFIK